MFLIHLVLAPARLHQRTLDGWNEVTDSIRNAWKADSASTIDVWKKSNDSADYSSRNLILFRQIEMAKVLRELLAASELAAATDDC